nr:vegetative cell wall protein gp1-like [Aegilops tauschii subsp. strangulata]
MHSPRGRLQAPAPHPSLPGRLPLLACPVWPAAGPNVLGEREDRMLDHSRLPPGPSASCPAPGFRGLRTANPELGPSASARTSTSMCPGRRLRPPAPDPRRVASGCPAPTSSGSPPGRLLPTLTPASPPLAPAPVAAPSLNPAPGSPGRPDQPPAPPRPGPPALPAPASAVSAPAGSARTGRAPVPRDSAPSGVPGGLPRWLARARTAGSTRHPAGSAACRPRPHPGRRLPRPARPTAGSPLDPARRLHLRRLLPCPRPPVPRDSAPSGVPKASHAGWLAPARPAPPATRPAPPLAGPAPHPG